MHTYIKKKPTKRRWRRRNIAEKKFKCKLKIPFVCPLSAILYNLFETLELFSFHFAHFARLVVALKSKVNSRLCAKL